MLYHANFCTFYSLSQIDLEAEGVQMKVKPGMYFTIMFKSFGVVTYDMEAGDPDSYCGGVPAQQTFLKGDQNNYAVFNLELRKYRIQWNYYCDGLFHLLMFLTFSSPLFHY